MSFKIRNWYATILVLFCLLSSTEIVFSQNTAHFIALDKNGVLYDVNPTTCTYSTLNFCSNITSSGANPLSIAISGTTLYIVDSKGKLWKETYNSVGTCTLVGSFSSTSGYYGLTVDPNGIVYAATGGKLETYNPTTNTFAVVGTLPTQWTIGGDLLFYQGQLYMACKNLDLIKVNLGS
jgi:sugar lactone lactonase YvrE